jgi:hypothetical protein
MSFAVCDGGRAFSLQRVGFPNAEGASERCGCLFVTMV